MQDVINNHVKQSINIIDEYKPLKHQNEYKYIDQPISKSFCDNLPGEDPLQSLLQKSREIISKYKIELPHCDSEYQQLPKVNSQYTLYYDSMVYPSSNIKIFQDGTKTTRERNELVEQYLGSPQTKTIMKQSEPVEQYVVSPQVSATNKRVSSHNEESDDSTPKKVQSTPQRKATRLTISPFKETKREMVKQKVEKEVGKEDELACHANNILRMAIDSTMLSSLDSTTLPHLTLNNSDFQDDFDSNDDSICGLRKSQNQRKKDLGSSQTIEINEEDLRAAIDG
ncbi:hypothetical protein KGF56_001626 [Candida oxycetoniae]|uniref:Uncharacterized protein n=1 Tax=Candida oxycetoniae TaxID=497107 RepID=A0AAI9SYL7_9ASCO|nr:uncharacterized protein KGF56_001626 [Candida oxycetoniae]KAI3405608.2 hypothetical protein KGF56_001626 [Candida oxycetoniae]